MFSRILIICCDLFAQVSLSYFDSLLRSVRASFVSAVEKRSHNIALCASLESIAAFHTLSATPWHWLCQLLPVSSIEIESDLKV